MASSPTADRLPEQPPSRYRSGLGWRLYDRLCERLDRKVGWDKVPTALGLLVLIGLRNTLRRENLVDTNGAASTNLPELASPTATDRSQRTADGTYNDLGNPRMGQSGARFG